MADVKPKDVKILGQDGTTWYSIKGPEGKQGPPGPPINIGPSVANEAALKALPKTSLKPGDGHILDDTGDLWVWDGTKWAKTSHLKGDPGKEGPAGRSLHTFPLQEGNGPDKASDPKDPQNEPDKAHVGDIWIVTP